MRVVPTFDPFENRHLRLRLTLESTTAEELPLERSEKTLRHRIHKSSQLHASQPIERRSSRSLTPSTRFWGRSSRWSIGAIRGEKIASIFTIALAS